MDRAVTLVHCFSNFISITILFKDFYTFSNQRVFVNENKELWHYSTLQEMLGMTTLDHNANRCEKGYLTGKSQFRFAFNLPCDLATSFSCPGSPVAVKYSITVSFFSSFTQIEDVWRVAEK
ncbi:hypothetical protein COOONC_07794 [Cooperia oncophora]